MHILTKPRPPFVYICGAGPGDPALLTLKTHFLLTQIADVVVYDRLIPDEILALIPEKVEKIYAGKSCRKHHMTQDEINQLLVDEAGKQKVVVRLKGGDPFIFGRGGEEMLYLLQHHVPLEIVPGVNAADGCSAYQAIPLTHRGLANSVTFLTGHQQKGEAINIDYSALASKEQTLVIYMGLTHLEEITRQLIKHGRDKNTPAIAIMNGTTPVQKACKSTLQHLASEVIKQGFASPTIVIVGDVVGVGESFIPSSLSTD